MLLCSALFRDGDFYELERCGGGRFELAARLDHSLLSDSEFEPASFYRNGGRQSPDNVVCLMYPESSHKNEEPLKKLIVDGCRRGVCTADGGDIPLAKRGMAGKGSHYIGSGTLTNLQRQTSNNEMLARMRRNGLLPKKGTEAQRYG